MHRRLLAAHPKVTLEFSIDSAPADIVGRGFDFGVRPGRATKKDMVAVPIGPVQKLVVLAAPTYLGMGAALGAAREGNGLACVFEHFDSRDLASGALQRVLPEHELVREAFFLYYASRAQLPPKLRVFIDWFRGENAPTPRRRPA